MFTKSALSQTTTIKCTNTMIKCTSTIMLKYVLYVQSKSILRVCGTRPATKQRLEANPMRASIPELHLEGGKQQGKYSKVLSEEINHTNPVEHKVYA